MNRNNMSKKQRMDSEAQGYKQRYDTSSDATCFAKNNESCVVKGCAGYYAERPTPTYTIDSGRSLRNLIKLSGVKSHV